MKDRLRERLAAVAALAVTVAGLVAVWRLAAADAHALLGEPLRALGPWSPAVFVAAYVLWSLTTLPAMPLMTLAGVLYGPWEGAVWALTGSTLGAIATFSIGRRWGSGPLARLEAQSPAAARLTGLVKSHPVVAVALIRTAPVFPLTLLNYGLGATRMRFGTYLAATVGMTAPGVALYAGAGDLLRSALHGSLTPEDLVPVAIVAGGALGLGLWVRRRRGQGTPA